MITMLLLEVVDLLPSEVKALVLKLPKAMKSLPLIVLGQALIQVQVTPRLLLMFQIATCASKNLIILCRLVRLLQQLQSSNGLLVS